MVVMVSHLSLAAFPGETGENSVAVPAALRLDPGQHASLLPQGSLPHLHHV